MSANRLPRQQKSVILLVTTILTSVLLITLGVRLRRTS